jgi:hypothetical protein
LNNLRFALAFSSALGLTTSLAQAQAVGPAATGTEQTQQPAAEKPKPVGGKTEDDWRFGVTVYGWATSMSGSATARGNTVNINASIIDLIQKSDSLAAWDSYFEANKGRFGLYADFVWARLGIPASAAAYANPIRGVTLSAQANAAITTSLTIVEGGVLFEAAKWPGSDRSFTAFDVYAGARYWNSSTEVNLDLTGSLDFSDPRLARFDRSRTIGVAASGTLQWVDPLIGVRLRHQFTPSQEIMVKGDVGGFGIPGSSTFSWQVAGLYGYTWQFDGYALAAIGGYRALSTNITFGSGTDANNLNLLMHGPIVGLTVKF